MLREDVLALLIAHKAELTEQGVDALFLFGSFARNEAKADSDVDLLVEFNPTRPIGIFAFLRLKEYLETLLGLRVDLVTPDALKRQLREGILSEAIRAA